MAKELSKFAHPDYMARLPDWTKIRDCYDGERAIKSKTTEYLPQLGGQTATDYANYLYRALFFPITGKTVSSMVGLATSKPPKLDYPELMSNYFSDTDSHEYQFTEFYVCTLNEVVMQGRYGILVDASDTVESDPKPCTYLAENIVNWNWSEEFGLTMLLLREFTTEAGEDRFSLKTVTRYRHCFVSNGVYYQEVLNEDLEVVRASIAPTFSGSVIDYIPFVCIGSSGVHMWVDKPPMLDISTLNLSHYLSSADLEWGRHLVGLPTPVVTGVDSGSKLQVGGVTAWVLPPPEAKAFYLEFQGQGLGTLENAMKEKIGLMSAMSARLVDSSSRGSEAAESVRLRYVNESASLTHIIGSVETGLIIFYNMIAKLKKLSSAVTLAFPRDVLGAGITFGDLKVLFDAYMEGHISKETLVYNIRRIGAIDPARTDDEELASIREPNPKPTLTTPPMAK